MSPPEFLRKLGSYPPREWSWMIEAALSLAWARLLIRFVPYRRWRRRMGPIGWNAGSTTLGEPDRARVMLVQRWVNRAAANVSFRANCLPQAMAARWMLARRGIATELHIGSRRAVEASETRPVDLHAWLMCADRCVTGHRERAEFSAFARPAS